MDDTNKTAEEKVEEAAKTGETLIVEPETPVVEQPTEEKV
jgi:hypothetical protein